MFNRVIHIPLEYSRCVLYFWSVDKRVPEVNDHTSLPTNWWQRQVSRSSHGRLVLFQISHWGDSFLLEILSILLFMVHWAIWVQGHLDIGSGGVGDEKKEIASQMDSNDIYVYNLPTR